MAGALGSAYDTLIVAAGARQSYFGHDEFGVHAPGLKTIDDALEVRGRIFGAFELAEAEQDERQRDGWLTIAVIGAGPTGVEVAGQIVELSRRALKRNFRTFDPAQARVILLDAGDTVLPTFPESLRRRAHRDLRRLGVETRLGTKVTGVDENGLDVVCPDGSSGRIEARTKVWAAGVKASALGARLAEKSGAAVDRSGRVAVLPDCTLPGHPEVFVIGDLMSLNGLPGVAEVAMQSGRHAARTIVRRLRGEDTMREFRYHDLGTMATVSRFRAVAWLGPLRVGGAVAWLLWLVVHLAFLTGFKNRVATLVRWAIAFLGRGRPERTITEQQVFARTRKSERGSGNDLAMTQPDDSERRVVQPTLRPTPCVRPGATGCWPCGWTHETNGAGPFASSAQSAATRTFVHAEVSYAAAGRAIAARSAAAASSESSAATYDANANTRISGSA